MDEILEQILDGEIQCGMGSLAFSVSEIALVLAPGALYEGTFAVYADGEGATCGYVTSTELRMECLTPDFQGAEASVGYRFRAAHLQPGEEIRGEFHIVSNRGEYRLPFSVQIRRQEIVSSVGEIRDLSQFAALARDSWMEAVKLFYSPDFADLLWELDTGGILRTKEGKSLSLYYKGLAANVGNPYGLEEFLVLAGQKPRMEYTVRQKELVLENPMGVTEEAVTILKNVWGYTRLKLEAEGDFLSLEKEVLTDDDFLGNRCRLPVYLDSSRMHYGRNYGRICLSNPFQSLEVKVTVKIGGGSTAAGTARRERKQIWVKLLEWYQSYRLKQISSQTWIKNSGALIERLVAMDDKDVSARLLQAQLLIGRERYHEGNWILEHSLDLMDQYEEEDAGLYAYYLYLTTLLKPESWYLRQVCGELEELHKRNPNSWQAAWVLLFLSPEYNQKPVSKWRFLEKQFERGCTSPLIYLEALQLLNENPAMLRALKSFEIQVLHYGSRKDALSAQLVDQMLYLSGKRRDFSPVLLRVLISCYEKKSNPDILREICSQLIKGGLTGPRVFRWYELGVEQELRLTQLYEYYMMSIDLEKEQALSKKALLYFAYQTNLDYEHTAFLYRYVVSRRESLGELYETYRERIAFFVLDQIKKEHINRDLAVLYQAFLEPAVFENRMAQSLTRLLFAYSVKVEGLEICRILCCRPDMDRIVSYPAGGSGTWIALYHPEDVVLLEDKEGNRYAAEGRCQLTRLMDPEQFLGLTCFYALTERLEEGLKLAGVGEIPPQDATPYLEFARYIWEQAADGQPTAEQLYCGRMLAQSDLVTTSYRQEVRLGLLQDYAAADDVRSMDALLEQLSFEDLDRWGRSQVMGYLVARGWMDKAYQWIIEDSPSAVEGKHLLQVISAQTERRDFWEDEVLLQCAALAYRKGRYDGNILHFLALHFRGLTGEMANIWRAARSFGADTTGMCERLLRQMLFVGSEIGEKAEIFRYYVSQGADPDLEEVFLYQNACDYFGRGKELDPVIAREIGRMYLRGENVHKIEKLAYLCYFSGKDEGEFPESGRVLQDFLREMLEQGIFLNAFRKLPTENDLVDSMQDKTIVEYRSRAECKTMIRYRILEPKGAWGDFRREEMIPVCRGLYCWETTLFFGESLQYEIEQEPDGVAVKVSEGTIHKEETPSDVSACRYEMINDILLADALEDYETLDKLLEDYYHREYLGKQLLDRR